MGTDDDDDGEGPRGLPGRGPRFASLEHLPVGSFAGVVLANELLDNLPFALLERDSPATARQPESSGDEWSEIRVGFDDSEEELVEVLVPANPLLAEQASALAPDVLPGGRIPIQSAATEWLRDALRTLERGRVVVIDYAETTTELSRRPQSEWVRTYRNGGPGGSPLELPGSQDITCEVCVDQLARARHGALDRSQSEFLVAHGLGALVEHARAEWHAGAAAGGLDSLKARSRVDEAAALTDPTGLGAFRVLEWTVG
jgi:SAM-dependent MidA family methyltransferase